MDKPVVSVIIPCYNHGKFLDECIQSILRSDYTAYEVIVVNDGSIDSFTNQFIDKINHPDIRIIKTKNQGLAMARNTGIKASSGKYILPLDADDKISPTYISKGLKILDNDETIKVVTAETRLFGAVNHRMDLLNFNMENLICQNTMVCSSFFRRKDFDLTHGYNPNMKYGFEDWDFWLSLLETGGSVYRIPEEHFFYRIKKNSMITNLQQKETYLRNMRYQLYINHKKLYSTYFFDPVKSFEYDLIYNSREYKLGKWLLKPIRYILNSFNRLFS